MIRGFTIWYMRSLRFEIDYIHKNLIEIMNTSHVKMAAEAILDTFIH